MRQHDNTSIAITLRILLLFCIIKFFLQLLHYTILAERVFLSSFIYAKMKQTTQLGG